MRRRRTASRPTGGLRAITLSAVVDNKRALLGAILVGIVVSMALLSFAWTPFEPNTFDLPNATQAPSPGHPAGTDIYGRDIMSRIMAGAVTSIGIAASAVAIALVVGTLLGVFAGYVGGWFDLLVTRLIDVMLAIPALVFALGIVALLGPSSRSVTVALAVVYMWPFARITRTVAVSVRSHSYTEASRGLGVSPGMIVLRDVMPNVMPIMVVQATTALAWGVLDEASLGFLGLGVQPPDPSWGSLLIEGRFYMFDAPWQAITAGLAVLIAVLGINLLGDGLRDIIDPRSRSL